MSLGRFVSNRRARGLHPTIRDVFTVSAHLCDVLTVVHREMAHGVVTPYNVMITRKGLVKLSNLAFGELTARLLAPQLKGPFYDSIYVAPELATDSSALTPACDVYSLGMLAISLLTEHPVPGDRVSAEPVISATMESLPPHLTQLLIESLSLDPSHRPSLKEFRAVFEDAARDMGAVLGAPPAADELPIIAAVSADSDLVDEQDDPFADLDLGDLSGIGFDTGDEGRYLVQKGGLDYGPYTEEEVLEQLYRDEIDEYTLVVDRETDERMALEHTSAFTEAVRAYVPKREERRRIEAERRAELQRKVKKGGVAGLVVACVVGAVTAIAMIVVIALQPDPEPLPMDQAFASLDQFKLLPPPKDFETLAVDQGEIQKIFDPRASESELRARLKRFKKKRGRQRAGSGLPGGDNVTTVDFGAGGSKHVLTDDEVYAEIMGKFPALRRCVLKELNADSGFKGVTVQFFIRPSGTTGGVKIKESAYAGRPVGQCLVSRFRGMKFPEHGGFNKGVVFPLRVQ
ncbi:MAG: AgmX/PglI C-terminal domain-containing protein [Myxococcota bacterium]